MRIAHLWSTPNTTPDTSDKNSVIQQCLKECWAFFGYSTDKEIHQKEPRHIELQPHPIDVFNPSLPTRNERKAMRKDQHAANYQQMEETFAASLHELILEMLQQDQWRTIPHGLKSQLQSQSLDTLINAFSTLNIDRCNVPRSVQETFQAFQNAHSACNKKLNATNVTNFEIHGPIFIEEMRSWITPATSPEPQVQSTTPTLRRRHVTGNPLTPPPFVSQSHGSPAYETIHDNMSLLEIYEIMKTFSQTHIDCFGPEADLLRTQLLQCIQDGRIAQASIMQISLLITCAVDCNLIPLMPHSKCTPDMMKIQTELKQTLSKLKIPPQVVTLTPHTLRIARAWVAWKHPDAKTAIALLKDYPIQPLYPTAIHSNAENFMRLCLKYLMYLNTVPPSQTPMTAFNFYKTYGHNNDAPQAVAGYTPDAVYILPNGNVQYVEYDGIDYHKTSQHNGARLGEVTRDAVLEAISQYPVIHIRSSEWGKCIHNSFPTLSKNDQAPPHFEETVRVGVQFLKQALAAKV